MCLKKKPMKHFERKWKEGWIKNQSYEVFWKKYCVNPYIGILSIKEVKFIYQNFKKKLTRVSMPPPKKYKVRVTHTAVNEWDTYKL